MKIKDVKFTVINKFEAATAKHLVVDCSYPAANVHTTHRWAAAGGSLHLARAGYLM